MEKIPTYKMIRELPSWARVVKNINGIDVYNMNVFQNIMSWNQHNLDVPAFEYVGGTQITYGQLPEIVKEYAAGFNSFGINKDSIVTMTLPVMNEYYLSLFATAELGSISNNVNFLFLRNNLAKYTLEKKSDTLIILDLYLPLIVDQLQNSGIKKIIVTSLSDYLPEEQKTYFDDLNKFPPKMVELIGDINKQRDCLIKLATMKNIEIVKMPEIIKEGKEKKNNFIGPNGIDIDRDSIYSYTSGTTGEPKCIVFKEQSPNAIIEMHKGLDLREYVGDRDLVVIPPSHATGMFYAAYLKLAKGHTLVLQPIYNKETYARDLYEKNIQQSLAAGSFWIAAANDKSLPEDAFKNLTRPCSGGEAIIPKNLEAINTALIEHGSQEKLSIGGGAGEIGSSALTSYELDPNTKTNETGKPIPGVFVKIINEKTGLPVKPGERGILHISSAAAADRYLNNEKATNNYFYIDETDGKRYANLGDVTVQNPDGSYTVLGRSTDSYVDENGNTVYMFDTEYALSIEDPVIEWEISAFCLENGNYAKVAQVVLKDEYIGKEDEAIQTLCEKYNLDGVKIYEKFETSETTGKRDYIALKNDREGYLKPYNDEFFLRTDYLADGKFIQGFIPKSDVIKINENKII